MEATEQYFPVVPFICQMFPSWNLTRSVLLHPMMWKTNHAINNYIQQILTCPLPSAAAFRRPRTACTLRQPGEARLKCTEPPAWALDRLLISGEADHDRCSGSGLFVRFCSCGELRGLVKGLEGRWLLGASTLTSTRAPCRFLWKNRAREKVDLELSGLSGRNDVSLTSSSESILDWRPLASWHRVCFLCCFS